MTQKEHRMSTAVLKQARNLLCDPNKWTTFATAKDIFDSVVSPHDIEAIKFDALGACQHFTQDSHIYSLCIIRLNYASGKGYATDLNDKGDHQAIIDMFDRAIKYNPFLVNI